MDKALLVFQEKIEFSLLEKFSVDYPVLVSKHNHPPLAFIKTGCNHCKEFGNEFANGEVSNNNSQC
jgi:hypothetical protein